MPRIAGIDIPTDKKVPYALSHIKGIGLKIGSAICKNIGVSPDSKAGELTEEAISKINSIIEKGIVTDGNVIRSFAVEGQLSRQIQQDISRLVSIGCYRGYRHKRHLPTRGQRTRSNSRTRKGPRKTVAGKKGVKDLR